MTRTVICLPCHLAGRFGETGEHDCNGQMLILNEATTDFDMVICACPRPEDHPSKNAETTPDPNRGEG